MLSRRKPCSQDSVLAPLIISNCGNDGRYLQFGLSGGMQVSSVCFET